jgi:hypothetical protein
MKRLIIVLAIAIPALAAFVVMQVPLTYASTAMRPEALQFVATLQTNGPMSPEGCAARYVFFHTDYDNKIPAWIRISSTSLGDGSVRVRIYDPNCQDDSIYASIERIYLRKENGFWKPFKHEWSHTGRGRFGWTTLPTK